MRILQVISESILLLFVFLIFFSTSVHSQSVAPVSLEDIASAPATVQHYNLPYPGILPDHPLYFVKSLRDRILLFVTADPVKAVELRRHLADKQLAMGQTLCDKGKIALCIRTIALGEQYLQQAVEQTQKVTLTSAQKIERLEHLSAAVEAHMKSIEQLKETFPQHSDAFNPLLIQLKPLLTSLGNS